jgi:hypothetical protein
MAATGDYWLELCDRVRQTPHYLHLRESHSADPISFSIASICMSSSRAKTCAAQIFHPTLINHSHEWGLSLGDLTPETWSKVLVTQEATVIIRFQPMVKVHLIEIRCHQLFAQFVRFGA